MHQLAAGREPPGPDDFFSRCLWIRLPNFELQGGSLRLSE